MNGIGRRLFLIFNMFVSIMLGMTGVTLVYFPTETLNVAFLGKALIFFAVMYVILVTTTFDREHNAYWNEKDRLAAERKRAYMNAVDTGRLKGLWP